MSLTACTDIKRAGAGQPVAGVTCSSITLALALRPPQLTLTDMVLAAEAKAGAARREAAAEAAASAARLLVREALPKLQDLSALHIGEVGATTFYFMFSQDDGAQALGLTAWLLEGLPGAWAG